IPMQGTRIEFLPDGQTLLVLDSAGSIAYFLLWDVETGALPGILTHRFTTFDEFFDAIGSAPPTYHLSAANITLSPDGTHFVAPALNGHIWLWDLATRQATLIRQGPLESPRIPIRTLTFTPAGMALFYYYGNPAEGEVAGFYRLDLASGQEMLLLEGGSRAFALAADGNTLAWLDEDGVVHLTTLTNLASETLLTLPLAPELAVRQALNSRRAALQFTPDGTQLVVGGFAALDTGQNALYVIDIGAAPANDGK
ncbi:MAG: hypothetical protein JW910_11290, partial [Anaerolineae bacterium]|nr:hypothetical protein [Anaerolineae bacterium]